MSKIKMDINAIYESVRDYILDYTELPYTYEINLLANIAIGNNGKAILFIEVMDIYGIIHTCTYITRKDGKNVTIGMLKDIERSLPAFRKRIQALVEEKINDEN